MSVNVMIPTPLRALTENKVSVAFEGNTVGDVLAELTKRYGELSKQLFNEKGELRNFVNVYLNDDDIRYLQGPLTAVKPGDTLTIVPAIAGGRAS